MLDRDILDEVLLRGLGGGALAAVWVGNRLLLVSGAGIVYATVYTIRGLDWGFGMMDRLYRHADRSMREAHQRRRRRLGEAHRESIADALATAIAQFKVRNDAEREEADAQLKRAQDAARVHQDGENIKLARRLAATYCPTSPFKPERMTCRCPSCCEERKTLTLPQHLIEVIQDEAMEQRKRAEEAARMQPYDQAKRMATDRCSMSNYQLNRLTCWCLRCRDERKTLPPHLIDLYKYGVPEDVSSNETTVAATPEQSFNGRLTTSLAATTPPGYKWAQPHLQATALRPSAYRAYLQTQAHIDHNKRCEVERLLLAAEKLEIEFHASFILAPPDAPRQYQRLLDTVYTIERSYGESAQALRLSEWMQHPPHGTDNPKSRLQHFADGEAFLTAEVRGQAPDSVYGPGEQVGAPGGLVPEAEEDSAAPKGDQSKRKRFRGPRFKRLGKV